ncbi:hypothetical protein N665_0001s0147 [Sinapis alba]|nr:hypothetical protein N665_0001s0147 [Sinapis alba]
MLLPSARYIHEEDMFLCQVYMEISQDPITGVYQTSHQFWSRVVDAYETGKNASWNERTNKSIHCRIQTIEKATKKLHACLKQYENKCSSGDSNDDIIQSRNYALKKEKEENKVLFCDVNSIQDPKVRAYIQSEQTQILVERSEEQQAQQPPQASTSVEKYFNDFSSSGNDLPDY